jgi:hypothetical protein
MEAGHFVRMYTIRGGFVSDGVPFPSLAEAESHARERLQRDQDNPPAYFVGAAIWHARREVARVYPVPA